jgi:hypothetical protein
MLAAASAGAEPLTIDAVPIEDFSLAAVDRPGGKLEFVGGLQLTSDNANFGGLSGIDLLDAEHVLMIGDQSIFIRARLVREGGRLVGVADAEIGSLFPDGDRSKRNGDAEDVALDPTDRTRGVIVRERQANAMLTFDLTTGRPTNFVPLLVGADDRILRSNKGLESVAYGPPNSPLAGRIVTIAERPSGNGPDIPAWIAGIGQFSIVRRDDFDVSSARFLPNGDLMLLERRYVPAWSLGIRLRRIKGDTITVGARVDGEILLDAGMSSQIDNMEGLAVGTDESGRTILTLVSDDNFSLLQRTLFLQFALAED